MRLTKIRVQNFRSIKDTGDISLEPLQALVGENNAGKSNILRALQCFLQAGAGGTEASDFNDPTRLFTIQCEFGGLSEDERRKLRPYIVGDNVTLRKELRIVEDDARGKSSVKAEYHGYQAEPADEYLSISKIEARYGARPRWEDIATEAGIIDYVRGSDGRVNKATYKNGIEKFLVENDVQYELPVLGETQALGIPQNLLSALPEFYLLPAITDYSSEIDKRSSTTVFRQLMAELSERVMKPDPRYQELERALAQVRALLNRVTADEAAPQRLDALNGIETSLKNVITKLMPSVKSIDLTVDIDASKDLFSKGVSIKIDDGVLTDVVDKGHGMQRSLVFSLLQMLITSARNRAPDRVRSIILAIEEPELYIHPHCQRLIFRVLRDFAGVTDDEGEVRGTDQVLYTTHSPAFIEVWNYHRIGLVRKTSLESGTVVKQAARTTLGLPQDRKTFKMLTSFGLKHNEVFFSRYAVIVEGPEDEVGVIATARKLGRLDELPDEIGVSIVVTNGKGEIPKFQKVFNAFDIQYGVLLELDGNGRDHPNNAAIIAVLGLNRIGEVPRRVEDLLEVGRHFDDQRHVKQFFSDQANINTAMEALVTAVLPLHDEQA